MELTISKAENGFVIEFDHLDDGIEQVHVATDLAGALHIAEELLTTEDEA